MKRRILITTGDPDGIGYEVTAKALAKIGAKRNFQFIVYRSPNSEERHRQLLRQKFKIAEVGSFKQALEIKDPSTVVEIISNKNPAFWVEEAATLCLTKKAHALVTAPLSKTLIAKSGMKAIGHTDILKSVTKSQHVFMGFVGKKFNVVLATGHKPVHRIAGDLTESTVEKSILAAVSLTKRIGLGRKPVAVLGFNPHAGEEGLIGDEEIRTINPVIQRLRSRGVKIEGPLVPDAAFFERNWTKYSAFVCMYHDQGLIPFKMVHTQMSGAQISLGLPFIRTSVDHGTAKDIFGENRAIPHSMAEALTLAMKLSKDL